MLATPRNSVSIRPHSSNHWEGAMPMPCVPARMRSMKPAAIDGGSGEDASAAALTFGKRLSKDLYVTYERTLSGTMGALYIFYDLSRHLTLRAQTGEKAALDLIYTRRFD